MIEDYHKARKVGRRHVNVAISQGRHPFLPSLEELLEGGSGSVGGEVPVGIREIPLYLVAVM